MFDVWITAPIKDKKPNSLRRLKDLVSATCLRRTKAMISSESLALPPRVEKIESVQLHQEGQELYNFFKLKTANIAAGLAGNREAGDTTPGFDQRKESNMLSLINLLRLICNHRAAPPTVCVGGLESQRHGIDRLANDVQQPKEV